MMDDALKKLTKSKTVQEKREIMKNYHNTLYGIYGVKMKKEVEIGDTVKDIVTDFVGVAMAKTEFFNGCIQFTLQPKMDKKKNEFPEGVDVDIQQLVIVKKATGQFKRDWLKTDTTTKTTTKKAPTRTGGAYGRNAKTSYRLGK